MTRRTTIFLLLLLLNLSAAAYSDHRQRHTDSLENVLRTAKLNDEGRLKIYKDLMWGYLQTDGKKSTHYARKALALTERRDWLKSRADALRILGLVAYGGNNYEEALYFYEWALAVTDSMRGKNYAESDIDDNLSSLYGSIGNLYNMQDRLHLAIAYYQKALPIFEKYRWLESTSILYFNVGELFSSMGNVAEAETNYQKAMDIARESGDSLLVALPTKGLGKIYLTRGELLQAEEVSQMGLAYYRCHAEEENSAYVSTLNTLSRIRLKDGRLDEADALAQESLGRLNEDTGSDVCADTYNLLCEVAMEKRDWSAACNYAQLALDADTIETYDDLGTHVLLSQIYAHMGETEKACVGIQKVYSGMEHFATEHYQSGLSQMEVLYETEKKQTAIEQLRRERKWILWGGVLVAAVLLLLALLFFALWHGVRLGRKHALVKAKLEGERDERVRIARDLHDRLGGLLTAIRQHVSDPAALSLTDEAMREMRGVAHHLLPDSLRRFGLRVALRDYCASLRGVSFSFLGTERHIEHEEAVYCIVYELVNNAVKCAEAQTIRVQLTMEADYTAINVWDDGKGMDVAEQTQGAGLENIRQRVAAVGGTLHICSRLGEGTEVNVEI